MFGEMRKVVVREPAKAGALVALTVVLYNLVISVLEDLGVIE